MAKNNGVNSITEKQMAFEEVKEALDSAADALHDNSDELTLQEYESEPRRMNFETLLKKYGDKELVIPPYQRRFVWNPKKQKEFFETIKKSIPTPSMMLAEWKGIYSLMDGFQRFTTLSIMSNSSDYTKDQQKMIRKYKVDTIIIHDLPPIEQRVLFQKYNSGIPVSGVIKQRANLSENMEALVTAIVGEEFPENMTPNITFNKSAHHDTITENALIAVSGIELGSNKPEALAKLLNENEEVIIHNQDKARDVIRRIVGLYNKDISIELNKKSLNANFVSILVRVIVDHPEITDFDIVKVISYIFAGTAAITEYRNTTGGGGGDTSKCIARYNLLLKLMQDPPEIEPIKFSLKQFIKKYKDSNIQDSQGQYILDFNQFTVNEKEELCEAQNKGDQSAFDKIIENKYKKAND